MHNIGLIALDLDGTLLNSRKELTPVSYAALERAANMGIHIIPTTGRFYDAMPVVIKDLPFVRYVIAVNGAEILDTWTHQVLYRAEIAWQDAIHIMEYLDTLPVIYDCFMDDQAWMTAEFKEHIDEFAPDEHYRKMLYELRQPVPELKAFLAERKQDIQKTQFFFRDMDLRARMLKELPKRFPNHLVSSSVVNNIEINHPDANKGNAIHQLCRVLGLDISQTMSFGDGLNDLAMLDAAAIGVVMSNAVDEVKAHADYITASCDEDGVAKAIDHFLNL
ncbi:MAG: HAD family phosphatase [Firmicutes bacterium]|nr:HAD family phosphatase [Bacillota bacterium]